MNAFAIEHPDQPVWILWVQAPGGCYMLLAGAWPSAAIAEQVVRGFGYTLVDRDRGLLTLARQMHERPDLYERQISVRMH